METKKMNSENFFMKLFTWFYKNEFNTLPSNTSNFYGKVILMLLLIIPYSILALPTMLFEIYKPFREEDSISRLRTGLFFYFVLSVITLTFFITRIYFVEMTEFLAYGLPVQLIVILVNITGMILSISLIGFISVDYRDKYKLNRRILGKEIKPLLIVKWYGVIKNKLCKNIEWS